MPKLTTLSPRTGNDNVIDLTEEDDFIECQGPPDLHSYNVNGVSPVCPDGTMGYLGHPIQGSCVPEENYASDLKTGYAPDDEYKKGDIEIASQDMFNDIDEIISKELKEFNLEAEDIEADLDGNTGDCFGKIKSRGSEFQNKLGSIQRDSFIFIPKGIQDGAVEYGGKSECQELVQKWDNWHKDTGIFMNMNLTLDHMNEYQINKQFEMVNVIGSGLGGQVYKCMDRKSKMEFVLKKIKEGQEQEVQMLLEMDHPNCTKLFGCMKSDMSGLIFLENGGMNLVWFMQNETYTEETVLDFTKQGLQGLKHMKQKNIFHLDLKPENTTVSWNSYTNSWQLKFTDFGAAQYSYQQLTFKSWTAEYMSTEACRIFIKSRQPNLALPNVGWEADVSFPTDMWSFGLTMAFLVAKRHIMVGVFTNGQCNYEGIDNPDRVRLNIVLMNACHPNTVEKTLVPSCNNLVLKETLQNTLKGNPLERITPEEALKRIDARIMQMSLLQPSNNSRHVQFVMPDFTMSAPKDLAKEPQKLASPIGNQTNTARDLTSKMKSMKFRKRSDPLPYQTPGKGKSEEEQGNVPNLVALLGATF